MPRLERGLNVNVLPQRTLVVERPGTDPVRLVRIEKQPSDVMGLSSSRSRIVESQSTDAGSNPANPTIYVQNENADRGRNSNQGVDEAVLVGDFDIPVVGTEFVSLRG